MQSSCFQPYVVISVKEIPTRRGPGLLSPMQGQRVTHDSSCLWLVSNLSKFDVNRESFLSMNSEGLSLLPATRAPGLPQNYCSVVKSTVGTSFQRFGSCPKFRGHVPTRRHWSFPLCIRFSSKHYMWFLNGKQALSFRVKDHHDHRTEEHRAWHSSQIALKEPTDRSVEPYARGHTLQAQRPLRERPHILAGLRTC